MRCGLSDRLAGRMVTVSGLLTCCVVGGMLGGVLGGCQTPPKPAPTPPTTEETVRLMRQYFTAADPKAIVGLVTAVLPDEMYAAVGDVDLKDFTEGEAITFIDTNKKFLTNGIVKKVTASALHVQYEAPGPGSRAPQLGDLAVRFKP
jgi:hypothetical protein